MNKVYFAVAILLFFPLFASGYRMYTETKCKELIKTVELAEENVDTDLGEESFKEAEKKWGKLETIIAMSAHHSLVEEINESFIKAKTWLVLDEKNMYIAELKWLRRLIRHVYETERAEIYNIF